MKKFTPIDHTADLGIEVYGKTLNKLFENSACGMFSLITDINKVKNSKTVKIKLDSPDTETLLITWLNELQYYYSVQKMLFNKFSVVIVSRMRACPNSGEAISLESEVSGEKIGRHRIFHDIKAATYHDLRITRTPDGYKTRIILDV